MRAIGLHPDVIVVTSRVWQTTCTIVRGPGASPDVEAVQAQESAAEEGAPGTETFVIDSPVYPDELDVLPGLLEQASYPFTGLLVTHGDWDHLLARLVFPGAPLGCAETTAARLTGAPGAAQRELRAFDEGHYVDRGPLALGQIQALPVPGHCAIGRGELELHPADGHSADGMAIWVPWARVLVCGDYLSPVEIPTLAPAGSLTAYLATLGRLKPLVDAAEWVVPGHGEPLDARRARDVCHQDLTYLEELADQGSGARLPPGRTGAAQRERHAENVARLDGATDLPAAGLREGPTH